MAENTVSQLTPGVKEHALNFVEREGEVYFSSEEIGRHLGFKNPSKSINILFNRNQKELAGYMRHINLMCRDGQARETRCFTEEGVYILSMLAQTPQARDFRARLARLLRELREQRLNLAYQAGYQQGLAAAQALPAVTAALQQARTDTARLFWRFGEKRKRRLRAVVRYRRMGLGIQDIAKLLDIHNREVSTELDAAEALGLLPPRKAGKGQPL